MTLLEKPDLIKMFQFWESSGFASIGFISSGRPLTSGQIAHLDALLSNMPVGAWQVHTAGRAGPEVCVMNMVKDRNGYNVVHPIGVDGILSPRDDMAVEAREYASEITKTWPGHLVAHDIAESCSLVILAEANSRKFEIGATLTTAVMESAARGCRIAVLRLQPDL